MLKEEIMNNNEKKYEDIIYMKRPQSKRRRMSMENRAAQFSAFQALTGYEDLIDKESNENLTWDEYERLFDEPS